MRHRIYSQQRYIAQSKKVSEAVQSVLELSQRYGHHITKCTPGIWKCNLISQDREKIVLQLMDKTFEPPRGKVPSDAPYFHIRFAQRGEDTEITWKYRWQTWKRVMTMAIAALLTLGTVVLLGGPWSAQRKWCAGGFILFLAILFVIWLVQNRRHDALTREVFLSILRHSI